MVDKRWNDENRRRDGLAIVEGIGTYLIMPGAEGLPIDSCPCCDKPFPLTATGLRAARLVADAMYPIEESGDAAA